MGSNNISGVALPRRVRRNHRTAPRKRARKEFFRKFAVPGSIQAVLSAPSVTRHRFTLFQWEVLQLAYPGCRCGCGAFNEGRRRDGQVATALGETSDRVRQARRAAEGIAYELVFNWQRANEKWHKIKQAGFTREELEAMPPERRARYVLDDDERRALDRYRKSKKGRRTVEQVADPPKPHDDRDVTEMWEWTTVQGQRVRVRPASTPLSYFERPSGREQGTELDRRVDTGEQ